MSGAKYRAVAMKRVGEFVRRWRDDCVADFDTLHLADLEALLLAQPTADEAEGDAGLRERVEALADWFRNHNSEHAGLNVAKRIDTTLAADTPTPAPEGDEVPRWIREGWARGSAKAITPAPEGSGRAL